MSKMYATDVRVYRFHDEVAVSFHGQIDHTPTIYIKGELAELIAGLFGDVVEDIYTRKFTDSDVGTWHAKLVCDEAKLEKE